MTTANLTLREEVDNLAQQLFGNKEAASDFADQLMDICTRAIDKEFLVVHNPGGWGHARLDQCLEWERGIVYGVKGAIEEMGHSLLLTQYFRSGTGCWDKMRDLVEQFGFFSGKANVMEAWLQFIMAHINNIKVILVGISQGAAFSSAVMMQLGGRYPVYSIELGFPFMYKSRRVVTERTLVVGGSGLGYDALAQGNLWVGAGILIAAPFKWIWY
ncbi:MAG: hypothetical protein JSV54_04940, partial [Chloroflexota bacterium]